MKKFYSMLVALIVAAFAITASAASFTIKIDHPERVVISGGYAQIPDPLTAESVITYEPNEYRNLTISAIGNNYIKSALDPEGNPINENYYGYVIYLEEKYDGEVFTITTGDLAEDREASEDFFTLTVDRPEKVSLTYSNTSKPISLKAAPEENVIKFLPDRDVPLSLDALENSSTTLFYSVKLNNEEQTPAYYGNYELKPRKGDKVDVKFDFPAQECKVKLSLLDGIDVKDALTKVEAFRGAEKIDITPALEMTVSAGYYLYLYFNEDWDYQAYQVNDEDVKPMYSSQIKLPVRSDVDLQVDIEPYPDYTVSLTVDNPANVTVKKYVGNDYVAITDLQAGANDIAVSSKNPNLRITPVAGSFISSIKDADGNNAKFDTYYKYYEIKAKDGENKWTIVSGAYPTDPVRVNFVRADGDTRNFNDYVINVGELVDGTSTAVEIDKDGFTALPGHTYKIYRNEVDYDWNSCSFADDSDPSSKVNALYNEFMVVAGGKISISATENEKITFTLNVDDPEHLTLYKAYSSYDPLRNITIPVSAGNNTISVGQSWSAPTITVVAADGYYAVIRNETAGTTETSGSFSVYDGNKISISVAKINRDSRLAVYMEGASKLSDFRMRNIKLEDITLAAAEGYSFMDYSVAYDGEMSVLLSGASGSSTFAYFDDEPLVNQGYFGVQYYFTPAQGAGVLKIYIGRDSEPARSAVTFTVEGNPEAEVVKDAVVAVTDLTAAQNVLPGTRFEVKPAAGKDLTVSVNGTPVAKNDEGNYLFSVNEDSDVKISDSESGIISIEGDAVENTDVYNLQGIKVLAAPTADEINALPAGIYIQKGKKIVVR